MQNLRKHGDQQLELQRWQAQQASREGAALNGLLGKNAQLLALSEKYKELRAAGDDEAAAAVKRQALAIVEGV